MKKTFQANFRKIHEILDQFNKFEAADLLAALVKT